MDIMEIIKDEKASIVDVRTEMEFKMGNVDGSHNMPMHEVPHRLEELKTMTRPLVLICASGNRSGQVMHYLQGLGWDDVHNGGGWMEVLDIVES